MPGRLIAALALKIVDTIGDAIRVRTNTFPAAFGDAVYPARIRVDITLLRIISNLISQNGMLPCIYTGISHNLTYWHRNYGEWLGRPAVTSFKFKDRSSSSV